MVLKQLRWEITNVYWRKNNSGSYVINFNGGGTIMIPDTDKAYIAGLFDGEGSVTFTRRLEKRKKHNNKPGYRITNTMRIRMEISMTDQSVLIWLHEVLGVGTLRPKKVPNKKRVDGTPYKPQWRWACTFRDAFYVSCLLWPWAHTKLPKIQQIIEYYTTEGRENVVDLTEYKAAKELGIT